MKTLYLILALVGAVVPYIFFMQHFSSEGIGLVGFVKALFANPAASGFTADLLITSSISWIFMFHQHKRGKGAEPPSLHPSQFAHWLLVCIPRIPSMRASGGNQPHSAAKCFAY